MEPLLLAKETLKMWTREHKIRIYLAADFEFLIPELKGHCEIFLMESNSIRHNPGAMWRFLALEDPTAETVAIIDSDMLGAPSLHIEAGRKCTALELGGWRFLNVGEPTESECICYRPLWRGGFGANLAVKRYPVGKLMKAFIKKVMEDKSAIMADHPRFGRKPMQLGEWTDYGFDEVFLLCCIYPRLVRTGIVTYVEGMRSSFLFPLDIEYTTWANARSMLVYVDGFRWNMKVGEEVKSFENVGCC